MQIWSPPAPYLTGKKGVSMAKNAMVIVNPASSNGKTRKNWPDIKKNLEKAGLEFDFAPTTCRFEATHFAREAIKNGYETIVSVGGDGTLNEVINGFFDNGVKINQSAKLGIIPGGTGGDFIRTLGYPKDYIEACKVIARGQSQLIDLGKVDFFDHDASPISRYFINVAGFGLDGTVVDRVNRTSKFFGGFVSFLYGTLAGVMQFKSFDLCLEVDGKPVYEGSTTVIAIANGQFFGGGMQIAPGAILDDDLFDIVIVKGMNKSRFITCLPSIYKGSHGQYPEVTFMQGRSVKASSPGRVLLEVDGEQPGILNAEITLLPKAMHVIC